MESQVLNAYGRYSQISTFLAGIFFTCIVLLLQQKANFGSAVIGGVEVPIVELISLPLTFTFTVFLIDALMFADASQTIEHARIEGRKAAKLFSLGGMLIFVSLFSILSQISLWIAVVATVSAALLLFYWIHGTYGKLKSLSFNIE